jgi:hypothetical protein
MFFASIIRRAFGAYQYHPWAQKNTTAINDIVTPTIGVVWNLSTGLNTPDTVFTPSATDDTFYTPPSSSSERVEDENEAAQAKPSGQRPNLAPEPVKSQQRQAMITSSPKVQNVRERREG